MIERYEDLMRACLRCEFRRGIDPAIDLEDLLQEGLLRVVEGISSYRSEGRFRAWMWTVVRRTALDLLGKPKAGVAEANRRATAEEVAAHHTGASTTTPSRVYAAAELSDRVEDAIARLAKDDRVLLQLRLVCQVPHEEIAAELGDSPANVRKRFSRARARLAKEMGLDQPSRSGE